MPWEELPDTDLMRLVRNRRKEAFEILVRRHQRSVVNFFRRLGVYNNAEDLAQETFLRLYRSRKKYKPTARFTTYLYTIARNVRIDMLRKLKRANEFNEKLKEEQTVYEQEHLDRREPEIDANELLMSLSEEMRSVVVLNIYQGLDYREIGRTLDIPVGTVKSRMFNAMQKMRSLINEKQRDK